MKARNRRIAAWWIKARNHWKIQLAEAVGGHPKRQ
jgi:hypothetical protein